MSEKSDHIHRKISFMSSTAEYSQVSLTGKGPLLKRTIASCEHINTSLVKKSVHCGKVGDALQQ